MFFSTSGIKIASSRRKATGRTKAIVRIGRDRIASRPDGGAGTSGGGWEGRSMSGNMGDPGGGRKDGFAAARNAR
jgi:hypothetical protein